jgi:hypothetical protein
MSTNVYKVYRKSNPGNDLAAIRTPDPGSRLPDCLVTPSSCVANRASLHRIPFPGWPLRMRRSSKPIPESALQMEEFTFGGGGCP